MTRDREFLAAIKAIRQSKKLRRNRRIILYFIKENMMKLIVRKEASPFQSPRSPFRPPRSPFKSHKLRRRKVRKEASPFRSHELRRRKIPREKKKGKEGGKDQEDKTYLQITAFYPLDENKPCDLSKFELNDIIQVEGRFLITENDENDETEENNLIKSQNKPLLVIKLFLYPKTFYYVQNGTKINYNNDDNGDNDNSNNSDDDNYKNNNHNDNNNDYATRNNNNDNNNCLNWTIGLPVIIFESAKVRIIIV
ncbi:hypothetical protein Glove_349g149 [Diversispora epigaea]|uniref:Uncharacterized protein n=1 Tax=Diversispora epigaea TaxID=1348612 RepID=A0A397HGN1_9GLOM|nr:hypothetical protein Glove_349g149 [Diversispora epigaea]